MEATAYLRVIVSLVLVVGLMLAVLWALRRFNIGGMVARPGTQRRLAVVETMTMDSRRRLVLVRRDGVEHLLMLGGTQDVVIERGIAPAMVESGVPPQAEEKAE